MMARFVGALVLGLAIAVSALAGQHSPLKKHQAENSVDNELVTCADAHETFKRVASLLHALVRHDPTFAPDTLESSGAPVTRAEVLSEFERLYDGIEPYFKFTPRPVWYDSSVINMDSSHAKKILDRMIKGGFVERVGPLATSYQPTISVADFGDAVGIFVSRAADVTHMPMPDYTPYLQAP